MHTSNHESHDKLLAEIRAEHAADKQFALEHQIGFTNHKSQYSGKVTLRQWAYQRGNRKCLLTRFPGEQRWIVAIWEGKHIEEENDYVTKDQAIYSIAAWLRGARMDL